MLLGVPSRFAADQPLGFRPSRATTADGLLAHLVATNSPPDTQHRLVCSYAAQHELPSTLKRELRARGLLTPPAPV
jgi:hypothetical protein